MRKRDFLGGLLPDPPGTKEKNWVFGAIERPIINETGDWTPYLPNPEKQATRYFDPYSCVSESLTNAIETQLDFMMAQNATIKPILELLGCLDDNGKANFSARFVAVGSGTIPGRGNSQYNVFEFVRKNGLVGEKFCPSNENMTEQEYFNIPNMAELKKQGLKLWEYLQFNYEDINEANKDLKEATKKGTIDVCVGGVYLGADEKGVLLYRNDGPVNYNHQVQYVNQEQNVSDFNLVVPVIHDIFDTYDPFLKKFYEKYPFGFAKIIYLKLKPMQELYKKNGEPAIYALDKEKKILVPFLDGVVSGGSFFKTIYGVADYRQMPRKDVDELPYPVADYGLSTTKFNLSNLE